jgi:hypothetical protein
MVSIEPEFEDLKNRFEVPLIQSAPTAVYFLSTASKATGVAGNNARSRLWRWEHCI